MKENSSPQNSSHGKKDFLVVGIGASAGGIKALKEFFSLMPSDSGMAFVVILHLSQTHESNLSGILQKETSMTVEQVRKTIKVEPNHVYVIPPAKHLEMVDGVIKLKEPQRIKGIRVPIDRFFRSLAEAYGTKAVSIILSGTGSDGTLGMKHIKGKDGFAIVQDPLDAEYDGMPRSAIETKIADIVLPVSEMPEKLLFVRDSSEKFRLTNDKENDVAKEIKNIKLLRDVLTLLRVRTGHDFSNYKRPTLIRRIARHLQIHETDDLKVYLEILREKPDEILSLLKNLLINVTNFFRDKEAFNTLEEKVIPALFEGKTAEDTVRVWIAGCASGEEAYSMAILLQEYSATLPNPPKILVFASDVDDEAIAEAREGHFTETIVTDVSPERLRLFFIKDEDGYRIRKSIREMVLFAPHNILRDPPFSRLDLISCRNVLIYLNRETQEKVLQIFHFALRNNGYLFLGSSETADGQPNTYSAIDKKHRIYQSRPASTGWNSLPMPPVQGTWRAKIPELPMQTRQNLQSFGELHHRLIEYYAPPSILVNGEGDILHLSESAGKFLHFVGGEPTNNILKVINPALLSDIRAALFAARQENKIVEAKNIRVIFNGDEKLINLIVRPVETPEAAALIMFEEATEELQNGKSVQSLINGDEALESIVRQIENELLRTKNQLRTTIEQYETTVEELKASNEELQAINEELRSATEELETGKEELQSVNEELTTVNHELKEKVEEISRTNSDLQNLMQSTDIATIFLDRALNVKRFTPRTRELFNIIPSDIGRPLEHITHRLIQHNFQDDAAKVLQNLQTFEREVRSRDNRYYLARFSPYRTIEDKIDGVVLAFIDITERKTAEEILRESEARHSLVVKISDAIRPLVDPLQIHEEVTHLTMEFLGADRCYYCEIIDDNAVIRKDASRDDLPSVAGVYLLSQFPLFRSMMNSGESLVIQDANTTDLIDEELRQLCVQMQIISFINIPVKKNSQYVGNFCVTNSSVRDWTAFEIDVTKEIAERTWASIERGRTEEALREAEQRTRITLEAAELATWEWNLETGEVLWNEQHFRLFGMKPRKNPMTTEDFYRHVHPDYRTYVTDKLKKSVENKVPFDVEFRALLDDDGTRWMSGYGRVTEIDNKGETRKMCGVMFDITERKIAADALRNNQEMFYTLVEKAPFGVYLIDSDFCLRQVNNGARAVFNNIEPLIGRDFAEILHIIWEEPFASDVIKRFQNTLQTGESFISPPIIEKRANIEEIEAYDWQIHRITFPDGNFGVVCYFYDLSKQKRLEAAVRESEERFSKAFNSSPLVLTISSLTTGKLIEVNDTFYNVTGYTRKDVIGKTTLDLGLWKNPTERDTELEEVRQMGHLRNHEYIFQTKSGKEIIGLLAAEKIEIGGEQFALTVIQDITIQKRAEQALRESEERLRDLIESITEYSIFTTTLDGTIDSWNTGAQRIFGFTETEAIGHSAKIIFTPEDNQKNAAEKEMQTALKQGRAADERFHMRSDGTRFYVSGVLMPLIRNGKAAGFVKIARDLTQQIVAEKNQHDKEMLQKLVKAQEDERRRIARDLHDELGQQLTGLRLKLEHLRKVTKQANISQTIDEIQSIAKGIDEGVDFIAWELRPTTLDDLGLSAALKKYVKEWSDFSKIKAELSIVGRKKIRLLPEVETNLYRITQEALNNVHKHAAAKKVEVVFTERNNKRILIISDDGKGFDPESKIKENKGLGLVGMQERAVLIGGNLEIESEEGKGTTIYVHVPSN